MTTTRNNGANDAIPKMGGPIAVLSEVLKDLRFGAIHLTVHDGKLVQLDVTEKRRFTS